MWLFGQDDQYCGLEQLNGVNKILSRGPAEDVVNIFI